MTLPAPERAGRRVWLLAETIVPVTTSNVHIKRKAKNLFIAKTLLEFLPSGFVTAFGNRHSQV